MKEVEVEPVKGRVIKHPVTGQTIATKMTIPETRAIRKAFRVGDLKDVAASKQAEAEAKAERPAKTAKAKEAATNG